MIHNGIEYGLMQAYAEGFDICRPCEFSGGGRRIPLRPQYSRYSRSVASRQCRQLLVARLNGHGSGRRPSPVELYGACTGFGEGRWTIATAVELCLPTSSRLPSTHASVRARSIHLPRKCCQLCVTSLGDISNGQLAGSASLHQPA